MTAPQTSLRPGGATPAGGARRRGARYEEYVRLRTEQQLSISQAATRLGVTYRQAQRHEQRRKAQEPQAVDVTRNCDNCRTTAERLRRGWCMACYFRWYRAGADPDQPPPDTDRGPAAAAYRRDELRFLMRGGISLDQAAARLGISISAARTYIRREERHECVTPGCAADATWRTWCDEHKDLPGRYRRLRAAGLSRREAAAQLPVSYQNTYDWEPGQPGVGRPRKRQAVAS